MLRQIKYFQSVIHNGSFSKAAEECHISQSAISQQIQALERELGFQLLERHHRTFTLTQAGEYFYQKSLVIVADFERICTEASKIAKAKGTVLKIGYLRGYTGQEFHRALLEFSAKYPDVDVEIEHGNHEELYYQRYMGCKPAGLVIMRKLWEKPSGAFAGMWCWQQKFIHLQIR